MYHGQCILGQFWFIGLFWLCSWNTGLLSPPHMSSCPWAFCFIDSCRTSMSPDALVHCCSPELAVCNALLNTGHLWVHYAQKHRAVWDPKHKNDKAEAAFRQADFNLRWDSGKYLRMKREDNYWVRSKCFLRKLISLKKDAEDWIMYFWLSYVAWRSPCMSSEKGKCLYISQIYKEEDKWYEIL